MAKQPSASVAGRLPLLLGAAGLALGVPSAGLAVVGFTQDETSISASVRAVFTPASVDPKLARRVAEQVRDRGFRFTPTSNKSIGDRTVTVAVRVDSDTAKAISVRSAIDNAAGKREAITQITPARYNLGIARGYQSFAIPASQANVRASILPSSVRNLDVPDLSTFEPSQTTTPDKPSRFRPRDATKNQGVSATAQRALNTDRKQTVDVSGAYRVTRNLDLTAGVRISQESDRLAPLSDSVLDNQAVYVGTQFKF